MVQNTFKEWLAICQREDIAANVHPMDSGTYRICAEHFTDDMFTGKERIELQRFAVPNIITPTFVDESQIKTEEIDIKLEDDEELLYLSEQEYSISSTAQHGHEESDQDTNIEMTAVAETSKINFNVIDLKNISKESKEKPLKDKAGPQIKPISNLGLKLHDQSQPPGNSEELVDFDDLLMKPDDIIIKAAYQKPLSEILQNRSESVNSPQCPQLVPKQTPFIQTLTRVPKVPHDISKKYTLVPKNKLSDTRGENNKIREQVITSAPSILLNKLSEPLQRTVTQSTVSSTMITVMPKTTRPSTSIPVRTRRINPMSNPIKAKLSDKQSNPTLPANMINAENVEKLMSHNSHLQEMIARLIDSQKKLNDLPTDIDLEQYQRFTHKFCGFTELAKFINIQVSEVGKDPENRTYPAEFKNFCLSLYFENPNMYKKLLKIFCMPTVLTLMHFLKSTNISSGVDKNHFKILGKKIENFSPLNKNCVICFDEIKLKPHLFYAIDTDKIIGLEDTEISGGNFKFATKAAVFIAKGVNSNWRQPIAYFFANKKIPVEKLKETIFSIISNLEEIGLSVCGLVCNMNKTTLELCKYLNVCDKYPYFQYQDETKAFIFDIPHLLISLRNNLMKYDFFLNKNIISWKFIKEMYEHDQFYPDSRVLNLTDSHIMPNKEEKQKIKYAAQVFSSSVATSMNHYIRFNQLPQEAAHTEIFIRDIDRLFDFLNSSVKVGKTLYDGAYNFSQEHIAILHRYGNMFKQLKVLNSDGKDISSSIKCVDGWKISISSFMILGAVLKQREASFLLTRRVNNDCTRMLSSKLRQLNKDCAKSTPIQFAKAFRKVFCLEIIGSPTDELKVAFSTKNKTNSVDKPLDTDYRTLKSLHNNFSENFTQYLIRKCLERHSCQVCMAFACEYINNKNPSAKYDQNKILLNFRHKQLADLFPSMDIIFEVNFNALCSHPGIARKMVKALSALRFSPPCPNFDYFHLYKLYVRVKLHYKLKQTNSNKIVHQCLFSDSAITIQPLVGLACR